MHGGAVFVKELEFLCRRKGPAAVISAERLLQSLDQSS